MSNPGRRSQARPQPALATITSTATTIPMAASAATGGANRPDDGHGRALSDSAAGARGPGRAAGRSASSSLSSPQVRAARARPIRSSTPSLL